MDLKGFAAVSIQDRMIAADNRSSGFDYMRLGLASTVILWHSVLSSHGWERGYADVGALRWSVIATVLPMFFAFSGFLVAGSLDRSKTLVAFFGQRILRILPALTVEIVCSALIIGPIFTTYTLQSYFTDPLFFAYFKNIVGLVQFKLPGVFLDNPDAFKVNTQLWTIPHELRSYILLAALSLVGIFARRRLFLILFLLVVAQQIWAAIAIGPATDVPGALRDTDLIRAFFAGVIVYKFRDKIPANLPLLAISAVLTFACMANNVAERFAFIPVAYMTVYLGLLNPPRDKWVLSGDYSYGIYVYGSVIQQAVATFGAPVRHWYWNLLISTPIILLLAIVSWWFVEKPMLRLKRYLPDLEQWIAKCVTRLSALTQQILSRLTRSDQKLGQMTAGVAPPKQERPAG
jgi:peptidoglycan/LPS O-acetylase OafA/YrhL